MSEPIPMTTLLNNTDNSLREDDKQRYRLEHRQMHERRAAAINLVNLCRTHARRDTVTDNDSMQLELMIAACESIVDPSLKRVTAMGFGNGATKSEFFGAAAVAAALSVMPAEEDQKLVGEV
jgi:hypothetical protein